MDVTQSVEVPADRRLVINELEGIHRAFERQNEMIQGMLNLMDKPKTRFYSAVETVVLIVGALGILHTADVIRRWITGG